MDVPTNALIWVGANLPLSTVRLNGIALDSHTLPAAYAPGPLSPNTRYEVMAIHERPSLPTPVELRFSFTTGSGPTPQALPPTSRVNARRLDAPSLSEECQVIQSGGACFDTPPYTNVMLETEARPLLWVVEQQPEGGGVPPYRWVWPAVCGPPIIHTRVSEVGCYNLIAVNETGQTVATGPFCAPAAPAGRSPTGNPAATPQRGGCSLGGGAGPGGVAPVLAVVMAAAALAVRRRGRQGRKVALSLAALLVASCAGRLRARHY